MCLATPYHSFGRKIAFSSFIDEAAGAAVSQEIMHKAV
jgi:hypothetical protein